MSTSNDTNDCSDTNTSNDCSDTNACNDTNTSSACSDSNNSNDSTAITFFSTVKGVTPNSESCSLATSQSRDPLSLFADFLRAEFLSTNTLKQYYRVVKSFIAWCNSSGKSPLTIAYLDIVDYRRFLAESGLAKATCNKYLSAIRVFFACLKTRSYRIDNPTESVKNLKDRSVLASRVKYITQSQASALLKLAGQSKRSTKTRNQAAIMLMAFCGLRGQEVCNIQRKDIDLEKRTLLIHGKGAKDRIIGLTPSQISYLQALLETVKDSPDSYLFLSLQGRHSPSSPSLQVRGLRVMIDSLLKKLGIKTTRISCHSLRHSCGVMLTNEHVPIDVIAKQFGHSSVNTTRIYTDIVDLIQHPATLALDKFLV